MPIVFNSFGDIVGVLQLAWQLRDALSEATGASAEIRNLMIDVDSFTRTLQHTKASIERRPTPLDPAVANGIKHAVIACHHVLTLILSKIAAFKDRMTRNIGATAWRQYWTVAAWSILGGKKDVDALRMRLLEQLNVIQTYLSLSQSNNQAAIQEAVDRQATTLERIYDVMQDIQLRFDVGVPTFQFYDPATRQYRQPFARTSLRRFIQLYETIGGLTHSLFDPYHPANIMGKVDPAQDQLFTAAPGPAFRGLSNPVVSGTREPALIQCCYFKERAFGRWQILLGIRGSLTIDNTYIIKLVSERKHAPNTRCTCDLGPPCKERFSEQLRLARRWRPLEHSLTILNLIRTLDPKTRSAHIWLCEDISRELSLFPDPVHLKLHIMPLLKLYVEHQRPSLDTIISVLRAAPRAVSRDMFVWDTLGLDPRAYGLGFHEFPQENFFPTKVLNGLHHLKLL